MTKIADDFEAIAKQLGRKAPTATADPKAGLVAAENGATPDLVTLIEKARAERADFSRKHHYPSLAEENAHADEIDVDTDRLSHACEQVMLFPSLSLADFALKAAALAEFDVDIEKEKAFDHLVADIGRLARSGTAEVTADPVLELADECLRQRVAYEANEDDDITALCAAEK